MVIRADTVAIEFAMAYSLYVINSTDWCSNPVAFPSVYALSESCVRYNNIFIIKAQQHIRLKTSGSLSLKLSVGVNFG